MLLQFYYIGFRRLSQDGIPTKSEVGCRADWIRKTPRAQHQHINDHLVMRRFLSREREKADQQLGIEQIPPIIRKPQTIGQ